MKQTIALFQIVRTPLGTGINQYVPDVLICNSLADFSTSTNFCKTSIYVNLARKLFIIKCSKIILYFFGHYPKTFDSNRPTEQIDNFGMLLE